MMEEPVYSTLKTSYMKTIYLVSYLTARIFNMTFIGVGSGKKE